MSASATSVPSSSANCLATSTWGGLNLAPANRGSRTLANRKKGHSKACLLRATKISYFPAFLEPFGGAQYQISTASESVVVADCISFNAWQTRSNKSNKSSQPFQMGTFSKVLRVLSPGGRRARASLTRSDHRAKVVSLTPL